VAWIIAHDHRFNDIDQALSMFEGAERDTWQKPDEVVKQLQLRTGVIFRKEDTQI